MKVAGLIVCVVAIAGLWFWAVTSRAELDPLPERLCGTFQVYRFEPPEGVNMANPLLSGQTHRYEFRANGTYRMSILVSGGYEMLRSEGIASLDRKQVLSLRRLSQNRRENPEDVEHLGTWWGQDEEGDFLLLRHVENGHSLYLRRVKKDPTRPG
jgi:hypothetical protein